uniref:NADH-ubiquinone oxidoreductase chain 6 n=1 Tax=Pedioplanis laticeps TaxID=410870 RepID=A0A8A3WLT5_9SAUR|nr:NADH dehydrogenase subunit 6 [Pedioplanis laticeps]QTA72640.1 NADH dehydrogenase subunit 6 [Pedioplanis laticeps]
MMFLIEFFMICLLVMMIGVASNPSAYYGAGSLVMGAGAGCGVLVLMGCSFVSIVLLLIYLGGMLVVFAYSVALAWDRFPESWGYWYVCIYFVGYALLIVLLMFVYGESFVNLGINGADSWGLSIIRLDLGGALLLYGSGAGGLLVCGWALLVTLFVVLELTRGLVRGGLRAV